MDGTVTEGAGTEWEISACTSPGIRQWMGFVRADNGLDAIAKLKAQHGPDEFPNACRYWARPTLGEPGGGYPIVREDGSTVT